MLNSYCIQFLWKASVLGTVANNREKVLVPKRPELFKGDEVIEKIFEEEMKILKRFPEGHSDWLKHQKLGPKTNFVARKPQRAKLDVAVSSWSWTALFVESDKNHRMHTNLSHQSSYISFHIVSWGVYLSFALTLKKPIGHRTTFTWYVKIVHWKK